MLATRKRESGASTPAMKLLSNITTNAPVAALVNVPGPKATPTPGGAPGAVAPLKVTNWPLPDVATPPGAANKTVPSAIVFGPVKGGWTTWTTSPAPMHCVLPGSLIDPGQPNWGLPPPATLINVRI